MQPKTDSVVYQKQKYCTHTETDSGNVKDEHINKENSKLGNIRIKKAHQFAGKTFVVISQEIVDKLSINEDTWFQQELICNGIVLKILDRDWNGGRG